MSEVLFLDGRLLPSSRARIAATDRALSHGFGVYETMRARDGVAPHLAAHLARMRASARRFGLATPPAAATLAPSIAKLCRANRLDDAAVRIVLTEGGSLLIRVRPTPALPAGWRERGARVRIAPWRRDPAAPLAGHKTLNVLESILARDEARAAGYAEALFLGTDGRLLEGSVSNVFLVIRGTLVTPSLGGILPGVTRAEVLRVARRFRIATRERKVPRTDLGRADEVFITNALLGILPVAAIAPKRWKAPGPVTRRLMDALSAS